MRLFCVGSTLNHWPFPVDHLHAGYCYIITHPGSPCIFYDHFMEEGLGQSIRELIAVRQKMRLHCRSKVGILIHPCKAAAASHWISRGSVRQAPYWPANIILYAVMLSLVVAGTKVCASEIVPCPPFC